MQSIYDNAKWYSLRDSDWVIWGLVDSDSIIRIRLQCYEIENILLTDDLLGKFATNWEELQQKLQIWVDHNPSHPREEVINDLLQSKDRLNAKISDALNIIVGAISFNQPRQFMIGQTIWKLSWSDEIDFTKEGSIFTFLGEKFVRNILNWLKE